MLGQCLFILTDPSVTGTPAACVSTFRTPILTVPMSSALSWQISRSSHPLVHGTAGGFILPTQRHAVPSVRTRIAVAILPNTQREDRGIGSAAFRAAQSLCTHTVKNRDCSSPRLRAELLFFRSRAITRSLDFCPTRPFFNFCCKHSTSSHSILGSPLRGAWVAHAWPLGHRIPDPSPG